MKKARYIKSFGIITAAVISSVPVIFSSCSAQQQTGKITTSPSTPVEQTHYLNAKMSFDNLEKDWKEVNFNHKDLTKFSYIKWKVDFKNDVDNNSVFYDTFENNEARELKYQKENVFQLLKNDTQTTFVPVVNWHQLRYFYRGLWENNKSFIREKFDWSNFSKEEIKRENTTIETTLKKGDIDYWTKEIMFKAEKTPDQVGWHEDKNTTPNQQEADEWNAFFSKYFILYTIKRSDQNITIPNTEMVNVADLVLNKKTVVDNALADTKFDVEFHIVPRK
ncbi:hypothetical protein [Mycoplasma procyoni]|uniref:hypothetical protein n=1 Tax=Mycoplasma procyoni TaxID=568784 RepID=UPI00197C8F2A|nr:hypothetical protein [Mycoplasma procyoni]MBN3534904.1 hypothetical protein [Mycoplasma procyoni]